jgi:hypothetical protein
MKRAVGFLLFHRAMSILLIVAFFSFLGERQYFSQAIEIRPWNVSSSPQNERASLSPSEVVKRYWKASTDGNFHETRRYIDFFGLSPRSPVDSEIIKTLTLVIPRSIYKSPDVQDVKPEDIIDRNITGDTIGQAINEITVGDYTYVTTPAMRKSLSAIYGAHYEDRFQELSEKYVSSNDSGATSGATSENDRRRSAIDRYRRLIDMRAQFGLDFAFRGEWGDRGQGASVPVRRIGGDGKSWKEKLSVPYSVYFLDHIQLRAHLHATSTFLAAIPKRRKPVDASPSQQNKKPGELVIGRIEEESLNGDTASEVAIIDFRGYPVTRSQFTLRRCKGEWKIDNVNLFYKDVFDLRKDIRRKEDIKKIASLPLHRLPGIGPALASRIASRTACSSARMTSSSFAGSNLIWFGERQRPEPR